MNTPQVITHYADGRPSKTRDMTPEEIAELLPAPVDTGTTELPTPTPEP